MKHFLDTSVLVATFYGDHEHHDASFAVFLRHKKQSGFTAAHCLVEVYSVLTGMPGKDRVSPEEALRFLGDVRNRLTPVALGAAECHATLKDAAASAISGGDLLRPARPVRDAGQGGRHLDLEYRALRPIRARHCTAREAALKICAAKLPVPRNPQKIPPAAALAI